MDLLRLPMYMRSPVWTETDDASNNIYLCMLVLFVVGGGCVWQAQLNCPLEKLRIIFRSIKDGIYWFDRLVIIRGPWNAAPNEEEAKEFHTIGGRTITDPLRWIHSRVECLSFFLLHFLATMGARHPLSSSSSSTVSVHVLCVPVSIPRVALLLPHFWCPTVEYFWSSSSSSFKRDK